MQQCIRRLSEPGSGIVTPFQFEKFSNGVKVLFRPPKVTYKSAKEEKAEEIEALNVDQSPKKSLYLSPEKEAALLAKEQQEEPKSRKKKAEKPEGGLEVVVDSYPYRRVRVRRCNMGPGTIVKEESERIMLREIARTISTIENDSSIIQAELV